jgi:hypothetical protein
MEIGLKESPMQNSDSVPILKGVVEFFDKILLQNKTKRVESGFFFKKP